MAFYVRTPRGSVGHHAGGYPNGPFVASAPLVMHDVCARDNGVSGSLTDGSHEAVERDFSLREAFTAPMGRYFDLCWSPVYSGSPSAPACYFCGERVVGRG